MAKVDGVLFCDGCGVEISWAPVIVTPAQADPAARRGEFCCHDCAEGRPCKCAERMDFDDDRRPTHQGGQW